MGRTRILPMANCDLFSKYLPNSQFQGTAQILFTEGDFSGCTPNNKPTSFCEIGSTSGFNLEQEPDTEYQERFGCGRKFKGDPLTKENGFKGTAPVRRLNRDNMSLLFRGRDATAIAQGSLAAQAVDAMDFSATASDPDKIYDITDSSTGTRVNIYNVTDVTISDGATPLVKDTDYVLRKTLGQIKFLTPQNANLTVEVTAEATTVTPLTLGGGAIKKGWMRILYFPTLDSVGDQCEPEVIIEGFGYLDFQDNLEVSYDSTAEATLNFEFENEAEYLDLRKNVN